MSVLGSLVFIIVSSWGVFMEDNRKPGNKGSYCWKGWIDNQRHFWGHFWMSYCNVIMD